MNRDLPKCFSIPEPWIGILLSLLIVSGACAQDTLQTATARPKSQLKVRLLGLGRDSLISIAIGRVKASDPDFDPTQYDRIRVLPAEEDIHVRFEHSVEVVLRNTSMKYGASVGLISHSLGSSIQTNSTRESDDEMPYFKWNDKARKAMKFVFDAINRSDEVGNVPDGKLPKGTTMTIFEESGYYNVTVDSWSTHSFYKVKKGSGGVYDAGHKHFARDGGPPDEME